MIDQNNRLKELEALSIMDTLPEEDYDNITKIASEICQTPVSYISFLDDKRQWYKSKQGMDIKETSVNVALCRRTVTHPEDIIVINDLRLDDNYNNNPYVKGEPNVVFYVSVPLTTHNGNTVGTLCVLDLEPKELSQTQIETMKILGQQVMVLLQLRLKNIELDKKANNLLQFQNTAKETITTSTKNIQTLSNMIGEFNELDTRSEVMIDMILESNNNLSHLIQDL